MGVEAGISLVILAFVLLGAAYDVELSAEGRALHSRAYRWRRFQNWFPMGVAYAAFYMARYNVAAGNVATVRASLDFSASFMGWVLSAGSWAYAASAPLTGQVTDRIGGKNGVLVACLGAALCNLALGALFLGDVPSAARRVLFLALYAANVLVQGFGTSAVVKINAAWYSASERGLFSGVFNIMLTSGYFLSLGAGSSIISELGWAYVFILPGAALLAMALVILCCVKNSPADTARFAAEAARAMARSSSAESLRGTSAGDGDLRPATTTDLQCEAEREAEREAPAPAARDKMRALMRSGTFLGYLAAVFCLCWTRDGFLNWFLSFFDAVRAEPLSSEHTAIIGGAWTVGGFVGGVLCGWLSDVLFHSDRVMPILIFSVLQAVLLGLLYVLSATCSVQVLGALVFASSVFLLGNYTLLSYTVPSDLPQDIAAGAAGVMTAVGYFSTGLSGACMGSVIGRGGYRVWILSLMVASVLAGAFTALGSHFSDGASGVMISEKQVAAMEADELTPLSVTSSRRLSRRASIVHLHSDFIVSPMPRRRTNSALLQGDAAPF